VQVSFNVKVRIAWRLPRYLCVVRKIEIAPIFKNITKRIKAANGLVSKRDYPDEVKFPPEGRMIIWQNNF
jgi:hypothetical protein